LKRLISLVLLFIFLFNMGGHLLLLQYFIYRSDNAINQRISHNRYKTTELVQMKIPVHMPAVVNWEDYEPISGQMMVNNYCYNYVELKITRDTMFLLCLPNHEKTRLENSNEICAQHTDDDPAGKKQNSALPKLSLPVLKYDYLAARFKFAPPETTVQKPNFRYLLSLDHPLLPVGGQPPEATA
jgi:hypothetical protein